MNILIICTEKLPVPPIRGGAIQTYIDGILPELKQKHTITVLGRSDEALADDEMLDGVRFVRVEGGLLETYRAHVVRYLQSSNEHYDLIHIFNRPRMVNAVRELAPDSKIILSMHNDMFKPEKIDREEGASAVRKVDKIITISKYIAKTIEDLFPEAAPKLQPIYSGVDLNRFLPSYSQEAKQLRAKIRQEHNLTSKKVILYAGRLSPNKGIDVLIRAIPELARQHEDVALVVMGSKWFSDNSVTDYIGYVRALAERLPIPVIQTGFVSPDKIHEWFVASDIFVCTSQWQEPLARVHYEAMAAALPIVTTDRGGNKEVIEPYKNGILVENPEDTSEFVKHLSYLISNPNKGEEMGRYGRTLAEKYYAWDRVVRDVSAVWDEVEHMDSRDYELPVTQEGELQKPKEDSVEETSETTPPQVSVEAEEDVSIQSGDSEKENEKDVSSAIKETEEAESEEDNSSPANEPTNPVPFRSKPTFIKRNKAHVHKHKEEMAQQEEEAAQKEEDTDQQDVTPRFYFEPRSKRDEFRRVQALKRKMANNNVLERHKRNSGDRVRLSERKCND
ncbi:glycosyltransferase family 4 protein [Thalassobacillus sp. CUG 92003]|uniref:glycosyltransferase family 4 protein n=1 Tax=Thalassobacillus sp. CUG 92003 TaxID=2736641 RepID=UPI0015E66C01|nr:glycosyltransferase family 4 protein [Thalassobacillus sp. CUG 92003]